MKITTNLANHDEHTRFRLIIDDKTLTIEVSGTVDFDFKQRYGSFAAMEKGYKEKVAPYLRKHDIFDTDINQEVTPISDLRALFERRR
jgi:hypothetical protein